MKFQNHLFISYSHIDNEPLSKEQEGWITRFHSTLATVLSTRLGRKAVIWRDEKLQGNDVFGNEIVAQFQQSAVLISIVTPRYVDSDWCHKEVNEFCEAAERTGALIVDNKARAIKVIKTPVDSEEPLPSVMRDALGYPFYVFDKEQTPIELDSAFGTRLGRRYNLKMAKLAWDITKLIKKLESPGGEDAARTGPVVYLAESSFDCVDEREEIETDLLLHGYTVLPDRQLSRYEHEYVPQVDAMLERASVAIHCVGSSYGAVPDGRSGKSIVELQIERAAARSDRVPLARLVWLPNGTEGESQQQQSFIERLTTDEATQHGADLITGDVEMLKAAIHTAIKRVRKPRPSPAAAATMELEPLVYIICDEADVETTRPLRKLLRSHGIKATIPLFDKDAPAEAVRASNNDLLTQADGVVVFYGAGNALWARSVDSDLRRIMADRSKPFRAVFTYLTAPATAAKSDLIEFGEPNLIDALNGHSDELALPLVRALTAETRGR